ncbi:hypothetical protein C8Q76DRAFT_310122 [Earliella scabrosa]|nr:hypothetical protein C8Q76DRAFT_310122 [Earliella scabrosa]
MNILVIFFLNAEGAQTNALPCHRASSASLFAVLRAAALVAPDVGTSLRADARPGNLGGELSDRGAILASWVVGDVKTSLEPSTLCSLSRGVNTLVPCVLRLTESRHPAPPREPFGSQGVTYSCSRYATHARPMWEGS